MEVEILEAVPPPVEGKRLDSHVELVAEQLNSTSQVFQIAAVAVEVSRGGEGESVGDDGCDPSIPEVVHVTQDRAEDREVDVQPSWDAVVDE